jgi:hypothetical protein
MSRDLPRQRRAVAVGKLSVGFHQFLEQGAIFLLPGRQGLGKGRQDKYSGEQTCSETALHDRSLRFERISKLVAVGKVTQSKNPRNAGSAEERALVVGDHHLRRQLARTARHDNRATG